MIALRLARIVLFYAAALAGAFLVAGVLDVSPLGVLFLMGAACVLASAGMVRTGSERAWTFGRERTRETEEAAAAHAAARRDEIARGVGFFLFGLALWATMLALRRVVG